MMITNIAKAWELLQEMGVSPEEEEFQTKRPDEEEILNLNEVFGPQGWHIEPPVTFPVTLDDYFVKG